MLPCLCAFERCIAPPLLVEQNGHLIEALLEILFAVLQGFHAALQQQIGLRPERRWSSAKVIEALADVMVKKGVPEHLRSDNGPGFVAKDLRK